MKIIALCHDCKHQHTIDIDPMKGPGNAFVDWYVKHPLHKVDFTYPERSPKEISSRDPTSWSEYLHNADVKVAYAATASPTITLASLAASSSLLSGRESTAIDNGASSVKYLDYLVGANYVAASSNNQAGSIYTCVVAALDDSPTWPDAFDGTDSTEAVADAGTFNSICKIIGVIGADSTASQNWPTTLMSVAAQFNGIVPDQFCVLRDP